MSKFKNVKIQDPLGDIADLSIIPEIKLAPELIAQQNRELEKPINEVNHRNVFYKKPKEIIKEPIIDDEIPDELESNIDIEIGEEVKEVKKRGKRGKDKNPRKKRVLSEAQKEALAKGRKKSAEVRRAKRDAKLAKKAEVKVEPKQSIIPPPAVFKPLDYDTFCSYMDQYSQKVRKKHSVSKQPHPNKIINPQLRPHPPKSLPNKVSKPVPVPQPQQPEPIMHQWTGNYHNFTQPSTTKKKHNSRWNFGL